MVRKIVLAATMVLILLTAGCGETYQHLTHQQALEIMQSDPNALILDVRRQDEYDKKHIARAVLLPIEELRQGNFEAKLPDKNQQILIYCWTGRRAEDAADILAKAGYKHVYDFGGLVDWTGPTEE